MNRHETGKLVALMVGAYPWVQVNDLTVPTWHDALADVPYEEAELAMRDWIRNDPRPPGAAGIRQRALRPLLALPSSAFAAWATVEEMLRTRSSPASLDVATRRAVATIGGWALLNRTDDLTWLRRDFIAVYDGAVQEVLEPRTVAALRAGLEGVSDGTVEPEKSLPAGRSARSLPEGEGSRAGANRGGAGATPGSRIPEDRGGRAKR